MVRILKTPRDGGVDAGASNQWRLGVAWSEAEFAAKAAEARHPMDYPAPIGDDLVRIMAWMAQVSDDEVVSHWQQTLAYWRKRAGELERGGGNPGMPTTTQDQSAQAETPGIVGRDAEQH